MLHVSSRHRRLSVVSSFKGVSLLKTVDFLKSKSVSFLFLLFVFSHLGAKVFFIMEINKAYICAVTLENLPLPHWR